MALGSNALGANWAGSNNAAVGAYALENNTTGSGNIAVGSYARLKGVTGDSNVALGLWALGSATAGNNNVAVGSGSGAHLVTGDSNVFLAYNSVVPSSESGVIRIGTPGTHTATFIAGIAGATSASGVGVLVSPDGQLGTVTSSARFKGDICSMDAESDVLMKLHPVSFYYRPEFDDTHTRQYGLVAEEVAEVAPELVMRDEAGQPQTVRYHFVNAMLLNEVQKQRATIQALEERLAKLEAAMATRE